MGLGWQTTDARPVDRPQLYTRERSRNRCEVSVSIPLILCADAILLKTRSLVREVAFEGR